VDASADGHQSVSEALARRSLYDAAAPVATASHGTVWAILAAEPPGGCRKRAELVAEDGGALPTSER
jgi:hypothetical protein